MALESALRTRARQENLDPQRLQRELVCQRLMARLLVVAPDRWALKGGVALDFRFGSRARTTRDMDLAWLDDEEKADRDLIDAQQVDLGDYFTFRVEKVMRDEGLEERTARYRVWVDLAGRRYTDLALDINFQIDLWGVPELVPPPTYLQFPGLDATRVPTLSIEQHIAEKCHAYTRTYASGPSSRVKDLVDLVLIASHSGPDARRLRQALHGVFARRSTHDLPRTLPQPPDDWRTPFRKLALEPGIDPDVTARHRKAAALLNPVLSDEVRHGTWLPHEERWVEGE
jgi:hypothetical protein